MDAFVAALVELLTDWGYPGLFLSALLAGSVVPFSSEVVLLALIKLGLNPTLCIVAAALGNTAGGMTCYYMGRLGRMDPIEKYFKVKRAKIERVQRWLSGKGAMMAFFAFLPALGEVIAIALGLMRSNLWVTALAMFTGKLMRYVVLYLAMREVVALIY